MMHASSSVPAPPTAAGRFPRRMTTGSWRVLLPGWGTQVRDFEAAVAAARGRHPRSPWTVGVLGTQRGAGVSTVAALMALAGAAWTDHRVAVLDTAAQGTLPTAALLGASTAGSAAALAAIPTDRPLSRQRIREFGSPGAAVPTFTTLSTAESWTAGTVLQHLRHRADVVVLDVPWGHQELTRTCWELADHIVLVTQDATAEAGLTLLNRLVRLPGGPAGRRATLFATTRSQPLPTGSERIGSAHVPRSKALARRRPDRAERAVVAAGLRLWATAVPEQPANTLAAPSQTRTSAFEPPSFAAFRP